MLAPILDQAPSPKNVNDPRKRLAHPPSRRQREMGFDSVLSQRLYRFVWVLVLKPVAKGSQTFDRPLVNASNSRWLRRADAICRHDASRLLLARRWFLCHRDLLTIQSTRPCLSPLRQKGLYKY